MVEFTKKTWLILAIIVAVLLILIPLLAWVGGDGMEASFEQIGFEIPEGFYPGIDLGPFGDYIIGIIIPVCIFFGAVGIFYGIKKYREIKQIN
ncbi:MAG: hypothetical protein EAX96_11150 [Candidatus Lokiarchaeota archaeon]|nr:hypothetical protein [Candidatus Lokiarchaeota archaeon]